MSKDAPQNALSNKHIYIARTFNRAEKIKSKISGHFNLTNLIEDTRKVRARHLGCRLSTCFVHYNYFLQYFGNTGMREDLILTD